MYLIISGFTLACSPLVAEKSSSPVYLLSKSESILINLSSSSKLGNAFAVRGKFCVSRDLNMKWSSVRISDAGT